MASVAFALADLEYALLFLLIYFHFQSGGLCLILGVFPRLVELLSYLLNTGGVADDYSLF